MIMRLCHRFVEIPTRHCLNLGTAAATVLWDRQSKHWQQGIGEMPRAVEYEQRGLPEVDLLDHYFSQA